MKRYLILEDGTSYEGTGFGAETISTGELALQTSNYGYQEALTDPTNTGKILVFATPIIGSSGINAIDYESIDPTVKGIIANDIGINVSSSNDFQDLNYFLKEKKIPAIWGIDTRALAHKLASIDTIKASLMDTNDEHAFDQIKALVLPKNKTSQVSTTNPYAAPNIGKSVAVIDLGLKHSMLRSLSLRKINVTVLPYDAMMQDVDNLRPDGIIISNGPGQYFEVSKFLQPILQKFYGKLPILGIGLGFLAISDFLNFEILDLPYPYNGSNYPVIDQNSNVIWQTAMNISQLIMPQNISLDLNEEFFDIHSELLAGFASKKDKVIATAFNPEGSPGTLDAKAIYDQFLQMME